jgi:hypothetical protein
VAGSSVYSFVCLQTGVCCVFFNLSWQLTHLRAAIGDNSGNGNSNGTTRPPVLIVALYLLADVLCLARYL